MAITRDEPPIFIAEAYLKNRSTALIAEFENGYAKGWRFAVRECFREALDIRQLKFIRQGIVSGSTWTQGDLFCFKVGDILYSDRDAYEGDWLAALKLLEIAVEVIAATPAERDSRSDGIPITRLGTVQFNVLVPDQNKSRLEIFENYEVRQRDFVSLLRTGILEIDQCQFDLFKYVQSVKNPPRAA